MNVLSLFAGIGGLDLGLEANGCTTIAYSEVDSYASAIMARHFPDAVNLGDITTIDWREADREHGPFDIICGGFPCQDISLAGKGAGIADGTRSGLWSCYADAIRELRPRGVLVENVAALLSRGLDRVLGDLAACGYDAEWDCIPAAAVGAPHLRDRLFVVAYRADVGSLDPAGAAGAREGEGHQRQRHGDAAIDLCAAGADTDGERFQVGSERECDQVDRRAIQQRRDTDGFRGPDERRAAPADAARKRVEGRWPAWQQESPSHAGTRIPARNSPRAEHGFWSAEPDVGRVAHGVPRRVDRLRCLGNAVVPQVAEHVARILMERIR